MKTIKRKNNIKKPVIIILTLLVVAAIAVGAIALYAKSNQKTNTPSTPSSQPTSQSTPTTDTQATPDSPVKQPDSPDKNPTPAPSKTVSIAIVDASQYDSNVEVRSYAEANEAGTCTYTFTKNSMKIEKRVKANSGPTTASCETLTVPVSDFQAKGAWELSIQYTSTSGAYAGNTKTTIAIQ